MLCFWQSLRVLRRDLEYETGNKSSAIGDRVALVLWLSHRASGKTFLVANTHLSFPHNLFDRNNQILQMRNLIEHIESYAKANGVGPATRIIAGDFNVEGASPVAALLYCSAPPRDLTVLASLPPPFLLSYPCRRFRCTFPVGHARLPLPSAHHDVLTCVLLCFKCVCLATGV